MEKRRSRPEVVEHCFNTSTEQERVVGYEDLSVAGYEDLVAKRSLPVMATQEEVGMEDQMELRRRQLLAVLVEEYKRTRTELAAEREKDLRLNWRHGQGIVFGYDK